MTKVKFDLDISGGAEILKNNQRIREIEISIAQNIIPHIEAQFFLEFGREGKFGIKEHVGDRRQISIGATDKTTAALLKRRPGWLDKFVQNIRI